MTNTFEYKGYMFVQTSYSCHIRIYSEKGNMVTSYPGKRMLNEMEARIMIEKYIRIQKAIGA